MCEFGMIRRCISYKCQCHEAY
ncbi:Nodule Cysteine-Rich (NCR) secreted peptide [Medicago truncatula]|uniref:Nodule Cysteine-Rich (NCR) secreted peptide n=1 Tax=Medicago truncatula TaxID=3880 RepID=A0A072TNL0_MEDTR|nr:Nodule Cysteine-Rich (NCR) secreted peptide [Medicago truncatula]